MAISKITQPTQYQTNPYGGARTKATRNKNANTTLPPPEFWKRPSLDETPAARVILSATVLLSFLK